MVGVRRWRTARSRDSFSWFQSIGSHASGLFRVLDWNGVDGESEKLVRGPLWVLLSRRNILYFFVNLRNMGLCTQREDGFDVGRWERAKLRGRGEGLWTD